MLTDIEIAREAWNTTRAAGDPVFDAIPHKAFKDTLLAEVTACVKSGPSSTLNTQTRFVQTATALVLERNRQVEAAQWTPTLPVGQTVVASSHSFNVEGAIPEVIDPVQHVDEVDPETAENAVIEPEKKTKKAAKAAKK